jgi:hypothetical protein
MDAESLEVVYVLGTYESPLSNYRLATARYPVLGTTNHLPDVWTLGPAVGSSTTAAKAMAVSTDPNNQDRPLVYVTGQQPGAGGHMDTVVIAYDADLNERWEYVFDGPSGLDDIPVAIAATPTRIAVAVDSVGSLSGHDIQVLLFDNAGTLLTPTATRYSSVGNYPDWPCDIGFSGDYVVVVGTTFDATSGHYKYLIVEFTPTPSFNWATLHGRTDRDNFATDMSLETGWLYLTGYSRGPAAPDVPTWNDDYFTIKANTSNGNDEWTDNGHPGMVANGIVFDGTAHGIDRAAKVGAIHTAFPKDGDFKVYVTGTSYDASSGDDLLTLKYRDWGTWVEQKWEHRLNNVPGFYFSSADQAVDLTTYIFKEGKTSEVDEVFVTGYRTNQAGNYDYVTVKYWGADTPPPSSNRWSWVITYPTDPSVPGTDVPAALVRGTVAQLGATGANIYVTGRSAPGINPDDFMTVRYQDLDH